MLRGELRLADLDPVRGNQANKRRPVVIVSNDRANSVAARLGRGVVTVVPVTSNTTRVFPFQTLLPASATGLRQDSKAQAEHVRSIAVEALGRRPRTGPVRRHGSAGRRAATPPAVVAGVLPEECPSQDPQTAGVSSTGFVVEHEPRAVPFLCQGDVSEPCWKPTKSGEDPRKLEIARDPR